MSKKPKKSIINMVQYYNSKLLKNKEDLYSMKFDYILTNPPFDGTKELHQQFFNTSVNLLNDGGSLVFIQPATAYFNKKDTVKKHTESMKTNLLKYKVSVEFVKPDIFENADINTDLAITHLTKIESKNQLIDSVKYHNGKVYKNVNLTDITITQIEPNIYSSIRNKFDKFRKKSGNLNEILFDLDDKNCNENDPHIYLGKIRPNRNSGSEMFTMITNDKKRWGNDGNFGLKIDNLYLTNNAYSYITSNFARFALSLYKYNANIHRGELSYVPLVDFNQVYTDDDLYNMIGLTQKEQDIINDFLPDYYGYTK